VPVSESTESAPLSEMLQESLDTQTYNMRKSPQLRGRVLSNDGQNDDSLFGASSDNTFKVSQLSGRNKASIPPPSERDIVRKHIDTQSHVRAQSPLGGLGPLHGVKQDIRARSGIRINSAGLPPPPSSGAPMIGRLKR